MSKIDYKKHEKALYLPGAAPTLVEVPELCFIAIQGQGDPNEPPFAQATAALYSLSYAVKMSYKRPDPPEGYYDYTVYPLEGVWDLVDKSIPHTVKSNLKYTLMIRQPDFLTPEEFERLRAGIMRKKPNPDVEKVTLFPLREGLCCQMLHVGPYDDEPASFAAMEAYCEANGYRRASLLHREIYLSDARKTEPARLRTVLRFTVAPRA
ncbi:MAG TPA: GyrI-like domain-containing protein [Paenibacillus sp.]|nr:GyrI-like domain-containing protein [Paenibacillus sp.]